MFVRDRGQFPGASKTLRRSSIDGNSIMPVNDYVEKVFEARPDANDRGSWVTVTNRENYTFVYTQKGLTTSLGRGREK